MLIFAFGTLISFSAWFMILMNIDPISTGAFSLALFFITLFAFIVGFFTTSGTLVRSLRNTKQDPEEIIRTSLRQSFFLGILVIASLILLHLDLFIWWIIILMVGLLTLIEFFALNGKKATKGLTQE